MRKYSRHPLSHGGVGSTLNIHGNTTHEQYG